MGRLAEVRIVDPVLTEIARGYRNAVLIGSALFPFIPVQKEAGKIPQFGKEAFKEYNTLRAPRADSNEVPARAISTIDVVLDEHDLAYPIDVREGQEATYDEQAAGTRIVTGGIQLKHEILCAGLAQTAGNFPSGNKVALTGSDQFTHASSHPIPIIETAKEAIRGKIGVYPNVMTMGAQVYKILKNHPDLLARIQYSMKGVVTLDIMASIFGVPNIYVGGAVKSSDADVFSDIWLDNVTLAYVPVNPSSEYEPAFGYSLRKTGYPQIDRYTKAGGKVEVVRNTDIFLAKIVGSEAGYLIEDTNV